MNSIWMRAGALGVAIGALGLLMVQAGLSSCGSTQPQAETPGASPASPPIETQASQAPASEPPASEPPASEPSSAPAEAEAQAPRVYMPATKAGPIFRPQKSAPPPAQQNAAPKP